MGAENQMGPPVFIVGEQRSGSNLLRVMLNQHSKLAAPHPPHFLERFMPLMPQYGHLDRKSAMAVLVDDVCRFVEANPVPWAMDGPLSRVGVLERCRGEEGLLGVYEAIMSEYAEHQNAERWVCKSLQNIRWVEELERHFERRAQYLYLRRDGRDVCFSFMNGFIGDKHPYCIGRRWQAIQDSCLAAEAALGGARFHQLSYEELVRAPEKTLERVCDFLEVPFEDGMLRYHEGEEAQRAAQMSAQWETVSQPVTSDRVGRGVESLSREEVALFEAAAYGGLERLEYGLLTDEGEREGLADAEAVKQYEAENKAKMEASQSRMDRADAARRAQQTAVIDEIVGRMATP
ncbi:MAG: sulfotransferase [Verrucomicrobiota bacterium]